MLPVSLTHIHGRWTHCMLMFVRRLRLTPRYSVKLARHALPVIVFVAELHGSIYGDTSGVPVPGNVRSFFVDRNFYSIFSKWFLQNEKKRSEETQTLRAGCSKGEPKISPRRRPPSRRGTAKIYSAEDGHYLCLQTEFGEDRCTQFRVIVVTDPPTHPHTHTHTHKQTGPITIHCAAASAQCKNFTEVILLQLTVEKLYMRLFHHVV